MYPFQTIVFLQRTVFKIGIFAVIFQFYFIFYNIKWNLVLHQKKLHDILTNNNELDDNFYVKYKNKLGNVKYNKLQIFIHVHEKIHEKVLKKIHEKTLHFVNDPMDLYWSFNHNFTKRNMHLFEKMDSIIRY